MTQQTQLRSTSDPAATTTTTTGSRRRIRLVAVVASVVAALLIWTIAVPVAGVDLQHPGNPTAAPELEPVTVFGVVAMSLLAPLAGWALLAVLEKVTARARTIWTVIAVLVLLFSYGAPLLGVGLPIASRVILFLMHTAVGLIVILPFARSSHRH